ncbi:MAG: trypsin-like cysteine/serine peptidase domain-containing protein [Piptocephalis tieghemiana]|nr:MAG: trypsin-like cysteine/serine peptidase domain-containing protein [Piptocephalis tieghemiana]
MTILPWAQGTPVDGSAFSSKLVGGVSAQTGQFPYISGIYLASTGEQHCTGSIISPTHILTAGHCLAPPEQGKSALSAHDLVVTVGTVDSSACDALPLKRVYMDPNYNAETHDHDFAILELTQALTFNSTVSSIKLDLDDLVDGKEVTVAAFGRDGSGYPTKDLQVLEVTAGPKDSCLAGTHNTPNWEGFLHCARGIQVGSGTCYGDSGSPLIDSSSSASPRLLGVNSYAINYRTYESYVCGGNNTLAYWGRASRALSFIRLVTGMDEEALTQEQGSYYY